MKKFVECGCCDHFHPAEFGGDCRDDNNRFTLDELPNDAIIIGNDLDYCPEDDYDFPGQGQSDGCPEYI